MAAPLPAPSAAPVAVPHPLTAIAISATPTTGAAMRLNRIEASIASSPFDRLSWISARWIRLILAPQPREEILHAVAEVAGAVLDVLPRALGARLGRMAGIFESLAGVLGAFGHRVADALCGLGDAVSRRLGAALDLSGRLFQLAVVGCESGCGGDRERRHREEREGRDSHPR